MGLDYSTVYLSVVALPCSLNHIKATAALRQDVTRGIVITKHAVGYKAFANLPGPVPTFFSEAPDNTRKQLLDSPQLAFQCMQSLLAKLLATEELTRYNIFSQKCIQAPKHPSTNKNYMQGAGEAVRH